MVTGAAPLNLTLPPASVVTLVSVVTAPMDCLKVVTPEVLTVRLWAPLTAPLNVMSPCPVLSAETRAAMTAVAVQAAKAVGAARQRAAADVAAEAADHLVGHLLLSGER